MYLDREREREGVRKQERGRERRLSLKGELNVSMGVGLTEVARCINPDSREGEHLPFWELLVPCYVPWAMNSMRV